VASLASSSAGLGSQQLAQRLFRLGVVCAAPVLLGAIHFALNYVEVSDLKD
jgi:hypothetical protein